MDRIESEIFHVTSVAGRQREKPGTGSPREQKRTLLRVQRHSDEVWARFKKISKEWSWGQKEGEADI